MSFYFFFMLVIVLSMDAFAAGLSYGTGKVHIPLSSLLSTSLLSGSILTISLLAGDFVLRLFPAVLAKWISFAVLFLLSLYKFYDAVPQFHHRKELPTTNIIAQKINQEDKAVLSLREAIFLAFALSVDNVSAGLCTGSIPLPAIILLLITSTIHLLFIKAGLYAGKLLSYKSSHSFPWLGAAILMILALVRLI